MFQSLGIRVQRDDSLCTSLHCVVKQNLTNGRSCELQVRTLAEEIWGEISHTINYLHERDSVASPLLTSCGFHNRVLRGSSAERVGRDDQRARSPTATAALETERASSRTPSLPVSAKNVHLGLRMRVIA